MSRLVDYYYELAAKALNEVHPVPPDSISPTCEPGGTQATTQKSAGSVDWAMDVRPSYKLTDAEVLDKMNWQFQALCKRERLQRAFEVPTIYPEAKP